MPSPYKTKCFDYKKIGCKSRQECIDKCKNEWTINNCNSLPLDTILDRHNDKNNMSSMCIQSYCNEKYNWSDCTDEYYTIIPLREIIFKSDYFSKMQIEKFIKIHNKQKNCNFTTNDIDKISVIEIQNYTPDQIYRHSPQ